MIETFKIEDSKIVRIVQCRDGSLRESKLDIPQGMTIQPSAEEYDRLWLQTQAMPQITTEKQINLVDLFSGTGPMSLGVVEAGRALNIKINPVFALDFEKKAADNYKHNFPDCNVVNDDIMKWVDGAFNDPITKLERKLKSMLPHIDFVIGGPPCQGHSDLNNHTRRNDPRNLLIFRMVRFVELFQPEYVIIENVQGIRHDKHDVLGTAKQQLQSMGYSLHENLLMASKYGVAQNRRRFLLVATKKDIAIDLKGYERETATTVNWAIGDLANRVYETDDKFNSSAKHSAQNQKRIDYLFDNDLYELPNALRPRCQQKDDNRYTSVYSRMYPTKPAPTITSGFGSIGQGRFGHPTQRRSITPHEAARLQFIPDFFKFSASINRVGLQKMIGNAVPPKLTYILALELLR